MSHTFVSSRLVAGLLGESGHAEVWGFYERSDLVSLCWVGANMVPVEAGGEAADAFAARARRTTRRSSSLFGPRDDVLRLWAGVEPAWGPPREVRGNQPLMVCDTPLVEPDPRVRRTRPAEIDTLFPASVAMFTEEIGYSPVGLDGGAGYKAGVTEMVGLGRSFVRIDPDAEGRPEVVFKAELGAVTGAVAQLQGVWVAPHRRGEGLAGPASPPWSRPSTATSAPAARSTSTTTTPARCTCTSASGSCGTGPSRRCCCRCRRRARWSIRAAAASQDAGPARRYAALRRRVRPVVRPALPAPTGPADDPGRVAHDVLLGEPPRHPAGRLQVVVTGQVRRERLPGPVHRVPSASSATRRSGSARSTTTMSPGPGPGAGGGTW